ncbi:hypothetical protein DH2020_024866 [Rehmannia glutinosa]|uniref:FLZ-type domain-containing protein n=1 Tax=Rehmannia glutinosa TaxID=99300 RepID=A0ABR0W5I6_REHGL
MPMKRSRTGCSSSCVERPIATAAAASLCSVKVMRTDAAAEASRPKFMTVASPVSVGESEKVKIGGFLERCHYCKKRIAQNSEVFMYSDLCAFCSAECRDCQITLDQSAKKKPENT